MKALKEQINIHHDEINDLKAKLLKKEKELNNINEENENLKINLSRFKIKYEEEEARTKEFEIKLQSMEENLKKVQSEALASLNSIKAEILQDNTDDDADWSCS